MKFPGVFFVPLLAAALLFATAGLHSAPVATAQPANSAQSEKPVRYHYVCPMHEDVTSKTPGKKCPKCKMKLAKKRIKEPEVKPPDQ